eukprot:5919158-Heterocapsa_arctica.AAC.1
MPDVLACGGAPVPCALVDEAGIWSCAGRWRCSVSCSGAWLLLSCPVWLSGTQSFGQTVAQDAYVSGRRRNSSQ